MDDRLNDAKNKILGLGVDFIDRIIPYENFVEVSSIMDGYYIKFKVYDSGEVYVG